MILLDTLFALLASPNVFQWIGAPQKECLSEVNLKAYLHRDRDRNYGTHTPKDEFRYTAALFLTSLAGLFICSHEVGHIVKGHLKFLRSSGDWSVLQEYMYSMPEQKHLQYGRLMEWDADAQGIKIAF